MTAEFRPGDRVIAEGVAYELSQADAQLLNEGGHMVTLADRIEFVQSDVVQRCSVGVGRAATAFRAMNQVSDEQISSFYRQFAELLEQEQSFGPVLEANRIDVESARMRDRSISRLEITPQMRKDMVESALLWANSDSRRENVVEVSRHEGWSVEKVASPLGVVGFVFEGRPNVCVDATGVLRTGNTCIFRIGSDALGTAKAIVTQCIRPALESSGLPSDAVVLLDESDRSSGWSLFSDRRLSLAVARGSGQAVRDLGHVAKSNGIDSSLHGTGGAWVIVGESVDTQWFSSTIRHSLDRKVCNTLNVCCVPKSRLQELGSILADLLESFGRAKGVRARLHLVECPSTDFSAVAREHLELLQSPVESLATEWEWDVVPELFLVATESSEQAFELCNQYSPQFVVSVLSGSDADHDAAWRTLNAPFVGNGFTRWVDGQYALGRPELGLSNWQHGRALARGGILSGDDIRTFRYRMTQVSPDVHR